MRTRFPGLSRPRPRGRRWCWWVCRAYRASLFLTQAGTPAPERAMAVCRAEFEIRAAIVGMS